MELVTPNVAVIFIILNAVFVGVYSPVAFCFWMVLFVMEERELLVSDTIVESMALFDVMELVVENCCWSVVMFVMGGRELLTSNRMDEPIDGVETISAVAELVARFVVLIAEIIVFS